MPAIKSILVPVDFSPVAANAFNFALRLADKFPARIDLLYCMPTALSSPGMDRILVARADELQKEANSKMVEFRSKGIDKAMQHLTGIPEVCSFVEAGDLNVIAKNRINAGEADIVVMGTSGEDKPLSGLVGTNTTYLIDDAAVPVLIVPEETGYRPPNRLCYATDLQHLDPFSISDVFDLFGPFEPVVDFAHVATSENEKTEFNLSLLRKAIDRPEIHDRLDFTSLYGEDGEETLLWHTRLSNADLLVMNRPHRGWLERLWRRSFTKNVMLKAELPLLILHGREREG